MWGGGNLILIATGAIRAFSWPEVTKEENIITAGMEVRKSFREQVTLTWVLKPEDIFAR